MRRSRGYILTEIMMSMLLQAVFIITLSGAFYMMLSFYTKTQQLQTARERGHRVISYVDQRIRHAGLGLWDCIDSKRINDSINNKMALAKNNNINLPVSVISRGLTSVKDDQKNTYFDIEDKDNSNNFYDNEGDTFRGNILTLAYAYRDLDNSRKFILAQNSGVNTMSATDYNKHSLIDKDTPVFEANLSAAESIGLPLYTLPELGEVQLSLNEGSRTVYAGSELLHFGLERLFVSYNSTSEDRSFAFALPDKDGQKWSQAYHHVPGIFEIYMELHAPHNAPKTFDLYVLSAGGRDSSSTSKSRPVSWPSNAYPRTQEQWEASGYGNYVLYVSRASWKLNNIPENFMFSYHKP